MRRRIPSPGSAPSKYGSRSCRCMSGHLHHSRGEAGYCTKLELLRRAGEIRSYKPQVRYSLDVNGKHITNHYVDFEVVLKDGRKRVEEYKGFGTDTWRLKKLLFEALYPNIEYLVVRHRPQNSKPQRSEPWHGHLRA